MNKFKAIFCLVFVINFSTVFAQKSVDSYKYVIVPEQFEFQKTPDQYQLNSLTVFLLEKAGFTALSSSDTFPEDLAKDPCLALRGLVRNYSNLLTTKVSVVLVDCFNNTVFETPEAKSKIKDYKKGYQDAVRRAFDTIQNLNYKYNGGIVEEESPVVVAKEVVEPVKEVEIEEDTIVAEATEEVIIPEEKEETPEVEAPVTNPVVPVETAVVTTTVVEAAPEPEVTEVVVKKEPTPTKKVFGIEGTYAIDVWGTCVIQKEGDNYAVVGGDENFQFATIYPTSKPTIFMIKKTGFSQTQLVEINEEGDLQMDSDSGVKVYKRIE